MAKAARGGAAGGPKKKEAAGFPYRFPNVQQERISRTADRPRLLVSYEEKVRPALTKEFDYKNPLQVPKVEKVVLDRLVTVALPRTRDFRGVSKKAFDGRGNYTMGIRELLIFPEIDIEKLDQVPGMNICIHTSAKTDEEGRALLSHLGIPFRA